MRIGTRDVSVRRPTLRPYEVAFVLGESEAHIRNLLKRGERLQAAGVSDQDIVELHGALPVDRTVTGRRCVAASVVAVHEKAQGPAASQMLAGLVEDRIRAARASRPTELPPSPLDRLHLL
jgi:hypothetical protein